MESLVLSSPSAQFPNLIAAFFKVGCMPDVELELKMQRLSRMLEPTRPARRPRTAVLASRKVTFNHSTWNHLVSPSDVICPADPSVPSRRAAVPRNNSLFTNNFLFHPVSAFGKRSTFPPVPAFKNLPLCTALWSSFVLDGKLPDS